MSLCLGVAVLNHPALISACLRLIRISLYFFVFFVVKKCICLVACFLQLVTLISADCSLVSAATAQQLQRGGHTRTNRCTQRIQPSFPCCSCVDSAASPVLPASHFSGSMRNFATLFSKTRCLNLCVLGDLAVKLYSSFLAA